MAIEPFDDVHIQLSPSLNFIIGEGGSGKSRLLRALMAGSTPCPTIEAGNRGGSQVDGVLPTGQRSLSILRYWIENLQPDCALFIEEDIFGTLGLADLEEAFRLLLKAQGQIVAVLPRSFGVDDLVARKLIGLALVTTRNSNGSGRCSVKVVEVPVQGGAP